MYGVLCNSHVNTLIDLLEHQNPASGFKNSIGLRSHSLTAADSERYYLTPIIKTGEFCERPNHPLSEAFVSEVVLHPHPHLSSGRVMDQTVDMDAR